MRSTLRYLLLAANRDWPTASPRLLASGQFPAFVVNEIAQEVSTRLRYMERKNMSHTIRKLMISAFLALTMNACLAAPTPEGAHRQEADTVQAGHYITSQQELTTYLHTTPNSPLDRLPADAKQRFLKSLIFGENGLASY